MESMDCRPSSLPHPQEATNRAPTESQTQQPRHTPKITTARPAKDHSTQKRRIEEKASKTHARSIQQPKPNTRFATRPEIQNQEPNSMSKTAPVRMESKSPLAGTTTTNSSIKEKQITNQVKGPEPSSTPAPFFISNANNAKPRKEQRQNARRTPRRRTYKANKAPKNKATFTFPRQTIKGRLRNKREIPTDVALLADAEILSWLISEYHSCEQHDYSWFFVGVMAQVDTLREMWPKRARSKSESEVSYLVCREIENGSIEVSTK